MRLRRIYYPAGLPFHDRVNGILGLLGPRGLFGEIDDVALWPLWILIFTIRPFATSRSVPRRDYLRQSITGIAMPTGSILAMERLFTWYARNTNTAMYMLDRIPPLASWSGWLSLRGGPWQ